MMLHGLVLVFAFTMQQILSAPFVGNLTASPDGTVLVWKVHDRGLRNLYTNAGGTVHKLTNYDQDDGQDISGVQVSSANDFVVYLHGGSEDNAGGENINPLSSVPPPTRSIYIVPIGGGTPVMVGESNGTPALSPRGDVIAWVKGGALQFATITKAASGITVSKPEVLPIRGQADSPIWSPDGSRVAFTNGRSGGQTYIVIYTPSTKAYVYATPDFSQDGAVTWSPDSKRIVFVRTPGAREDESAYLKPPRGPWSIWTADAATGRAHMAWQARRGMGATFYPSETSASQLLWMRDNTIAFLWEGDGWQHIYSVSTNGGAARNLTPGQFEVETFAPSLDGANVYYATNEGDIDRRHIWQVALDGKPHALTSGIGNQWRPTPMANGGLAYVDSNYNTPTMVKTLAGASMRGVSTPAEFPANDVVQPQLITFRAPDGLLIHAQLFRPKTPGKHPAMIFDHGGPVRQMLPGFHYMEAYTNLYESNQYLANHGFVVLSINYRSGIMYGHNFRQAPKSGWLGASEYQDVLAGAHWLQKQPQVDPNRLGIYGLSYGGYLTAMGLARNSDIFKAGADYAGVHNWATLFDWYSGGKTQGTLGQRQLAYDSSPIASLAKWRSPIFLQQGDDDHNVAFSQGVDLATRLRDLGVHVETLVYPNETHEMQVWAHMLEQYQAAADFLVRYLKP
jgi:dipeptidyl aminopeptidase/acylaminoacyl peptidase